MSSKIGVNKNNGIKTNIKSNNFPHLFDKNYKKDLNIIDLKDKLELSVSTVEKMENTIEEKNELNKKVVTDKKKKKKKGKKKKKVLSTNYKYKLKQSVDAKPKDLINKNKYKIKDLSNSSAKLKILERNKNCSTINIPKLENKLENYASKENISSNAVKKTDEEKKNINNSEENTKENNVITNIRTFNFKNKPLNLLNTKKYNKKYSLKKKKNLSKNPNPKIVINPGGNEVDSMNGCHSNNYTSKYLLNQVLNYNNTLSGGIGEGIESVANINIRGEKNAISASFNKTNTKEENGNNKKENEIKIFNKKENDVNNNTISANNDINDINDLNKETKNEIKNEIKNETNEDILNNKTNPIINSPKEYNKIISNGRKLHANNWFKTKTKYNFNDTYRKNDDLENRYAKIRKSYQENDYNQSVQNTKTYIYLILPGNASYLVKNCMCHRVNWKEPFSSVTSLYNFKWQQISMGIDYNSLGNIMNISTKQLVNHFENHSSISNKANMFINLMEYCEKRKISVFKYVPFTIIFQLKDKVDFNNNNDIIKTEAQRLEELKLFIKKSNKYIVNYNDIGKFYDDENYKNDQIKREEFERERIKKMKKNNIKIDEGMSNKNNININNTINNDKVNNNKSNNNNPKNNDNSNEINIKYESDIKVYSDFFPKVSAIEKIPTIVKDKDGNYVLEEPKEKDNDQPSIGNNTLVEIPHTHNNGKNIWIVKAINLNRGMCIRVVNSFEQIEKIIQKFKEGVDYDFTEEDIDKPQITNNNKEIKENNENQDIEEEEKNNEIKQGKEKEKIYYCSRVIIQKYIERPLLYYGRKCDMRIWVLLTQNMKVYVFKEGHLKTCSVQFDINSKDAFTHITNYSFQKYNDNFQKFESGNEVPFSDFQKFIDDKYNNNYKLNKDLMEKIKEIISLTMRSVKDKINKNNRNYQFEIFGYDFMLDEDFNVFLIEVNTNPGLEESSPWIKVIVPRMLDDALRLTLDQLFEPKYDFSLSYKKMDELDILEEVLNNLKNNNDLNSQNNKKKTIVDNKKYISPFPVPGYTNDENLWDFVCDLNAKDPNDKFSDIKEKDNNNINSNNNTNTYNIIKEETFTGIKHLLNKKNKTKEKFEK